MIKKAKTNIIKKVTDTFSGVENKCNNCQKAGIQTLKALGWMTAMVLVAFSVQIMTKNRVVIVNPARVSQEASVFQEIRKTQAKYEATLNAESSVELAALQEEQKKLDQEKKKTNATEFQKKQDALNEKVMAFKRKYAYRVRQIVTASQQAAASTEKATADALKRVAERERVGIVLNTTGIMYANEKTNDITQEFIDEMNKTVPTVAYPDPATINIALGE